MMRFLSTFLTLLLSQLLFILVAVVLYGGIVGEYGASAYPATPARLMLQSLHLSAVIFAVTAMLHTALYRRFGRARAGRVACGLLYVAAWYFVAFELVVDYRMIWGTTWGDLEFFLFYFGGWRGLSGTILVLGACFANLAVHRRIGRRTAS